MIQKINNKRYDLEERTFTFARDCRRLVKDTPKSVGNLQDFGQMVRSSGSVAANYIEANEALSKKDFIMRIKICKKESKETCLWLRLIEVFGKPELEKERSKLLVESTELMKIFGAILEKSKEKL